MPWVQNFAYGSEKGHARAPLLEWGTGMFNRTVDLDRYSGLPVSAPFTARIRSPRATGCPAEYASAAGKRYPMGSSPRIPAAGHRHWS